MKSRCGAGLAFSPPAFPVDSRGGAFHVCACRGVKSDDMKGDVVATLRFRDALPCLQESRRMEGTPVAYVAYVPGDVRATREYNCTERRHLVGKGGRGW